MDGNVVDTVPGIGVSYPAETERQLSEPTSYGRRVDSRNGSFPRGGADWWNQSLLMAKSRWAGLRVQAQHWTRAYPTQALLTLAGIAFTTGVILRLGKRND